ncbi:breast cancer anti-estrogen resistance protein 3 homolog isoform X1 [Bactrocera tryoni]|uniref:breast cancer anti-estrogen resistance protein 3 homolog isoform X1 n=2 Tax=Bactrocera tryoni TaxID=59916 RepID=UPI001A9660B5|nr:breast cancer anti-estrogen resistance protein 3 homolog isoform X1 [Bactrocera tryoni]
MGNVQTGQCDAQGMVQRRGSMSWNFRYPLMKRRDQTATIVYNMKMSIADWLDLLGLQQYETNFQMYNTVEDILDLTDCGLRHRGIRQSSHRAKMLSSLMGVQAKCRQSLNIEASTLPRTLSKRKNSCPPMYLSSDSSEIERLLQRNCSNRNSFSNFRTNSKDSKRLTFNASDMIYEELDPPETNTTTTNAATKPQNLTHPVTADRCASDNYNTIHTMDNVGGSGNLSSSIGGSTASIVGQLHLQQHHQLPPNSMAVSTPSGEQQEAIALKKALEWELSLDAKDLRSHAWYHGPLSRQRAEEIVQREGEFLIRDCASQPDNYVLTCHTKTQVLHFVINKILLQPETVYERVQYQFEEDAFDAVPDLITFYVGSGKPISVASGARIQYPCNRTYPLSFYGHKIVGNHLHTQMLAGIRGASPLNSPLSHNGNFRFGSGIITPHTQQQQPVHSPMSSPPRVKREIPPRLPSKKQRSQSLTPAHATPTSVRQSHNSESCSSADGIIQAAPTQPNEIVNNPNGFRDHGRRLSNFEKEVLVSETSLVGGDNINLQSHLEHLAQAGKLHGNGFQTIARCSAATEAVDHFKFTTHSLPRPNTNNFRGNSIMRISSLARDFGSDAVGLSTSLEGRQIPELPEKPPSPPPKPVRANSQARKEKEQQQQLAAHRAGIVGVGYHASGSDSGNGSGDSVQSSIPGDSNEFTQHRGVIIKNPRFLSNSASSAALKSLADFDVIAAEEQLFTMEIPDFKPVSKFDFENFITLLLPSVDNKPLDGDALTTFKMMLLETGPKVIAEHITRIDIGLLIEELPEDEDRNVLDCCGLEMLTLPFGKLFRTDLIERTQCIKLMVAVTILTCQTDLDRAELLSKWIQIAVETKTALGNLFGFCAIMLGLCMPQIQKLEKAWHILRQKYTDSAFTFEAKLRPTLISMNECSNPQAPNTTVPHVLLYALLKDRPIIDIISVNNVNLDDRSSLYGTCITAWEAKADDFGMTINFLHLDSARHFLNNLSLYRKNAKILLEESSKRLDELLSDAFRTEFHVKFLWGSNGVTATPEDRHSKLEKVLALMADKFCSVDSAAG